MYWGVRVIFKLAPLEKKEDIVSEQFYVDAVYCARKMLASKIPMEALQVCRIPADCFGAFTFGLVAGFVVICKFKQVISLLWTDNIR